MCLTDTPNYRGLVKWYDRGLQNLWWEFDSLIPCIWKLAKPLKMEGCELFSFYQFKKVIKKVINNVLVAFFDTLKNTYDTKKVIFI